MKGGRSRRISNNIKPSLITIIFFHLPENRMLDLNQNKYWLLQYTNNMALPFLYCFIPRSNLFSCQCTALTLTDYQPYQSASFLFTYVVIKTAWATTNFKLMPTENRIAGFMIWTQQWPSYMIDNSVVSIWKHFYIYKDIGMPSEGQTVCFLCILLQNFL